MQTKISPRVAALLERTSTTRGRLIFAIDATQSRENTWDIASSLQTAMFEEAAKIGGLEVQLVWFRGGNECSSTQWTADTGELAKQMRRIRCESGATQIRRVLEHIRAESAGKKINAAIFVGDAVEEPPHAL
jgi:von Willebrand factor type A domain